MIPRPRRVLLVEDDPAIAEAVQVVLADDGYLVEAVSDGEAALAAARGERFGLVLLDLMLPGGSGIDLLADLRPHIGATPVVLLTAARDGARLARGASVAGYLAKPFEVDDLLDRMTRLYSPI